MEKKTIVKVFEALTIVFLCGVRLHMTEVHDNSDHKYSYEGISFFCCDFTLLFEFYLLPGDFLGLLLPYVSRNLSTLLLYGSMNSDLTQPSYVSIPSM